MTESPDKKPEQIGDTSGDVTGGAAAEPDPFLSSEAKVIECRRQSDQLEYFAHAYCKLYGEWRDSIAELVAMKQQQKLFYTLIFSVTLLMLLLLVFLGGAIGLIAVLLVLAAAAIYLVNDRVTRQDERRDQIRRDKERFGVSLYLAGVDLSLAQLEEAISKNALGEWTFNAAYGRWREARLQSMFYRVYGTIVPREVIDKICSRTP